MDEGPGAETADGIDPGAAPVSEPVRVLQVLGRSAGGVARHVAAVVEGLGGRDGLVFEVAGPARLPVPIPAPLHTVAIPDGLSPAHLSAVSRLRRILRNGAFDLVHAHGLRASVDAGVAARLCKVPLLSSVHNLVRAEIEGPVKARLLSQAERAVASLAARVLAPSAEIARHMQTSYPAARSKTEVLYLGVGETSPARRGRDEARAELGLSPGGTVVVAVARLAPQKALHVLLRAIVLLPDVTLLLCGEGPERGSLEDLARELEVRERVRFLGWRDDVSGVLEAADAFCLSSLWEAVPLAIQEAVAAGVPVVATDVGGTAELITDGVSGRLVPAGDHDALAAALRDVLDHPHLGESYAAAALKDLRPRFRNEAMLARLADLYLEHGGRR